MFLFRYQLSEAHSHADALSRMTDHIFYDILYSTEADFEEARKLLQRILQRDLYKNVACRNLSTELLNRKVYLSHFTGGADKSLARPTSQCILFDG